MTNSTSFHAVEILPEQEGQRLDKALAVLLPSLSRSRLQALREEGCITLDGVILTSGSAKARIGQRIEVHIPQVSASPLVPEDIPLSIIYEDAHMLVIDKQAGLTVHPAAGNEHHTLVHALLAHCGAELSGIGGVARPGIVHRIDKDTSGLLVVAKHDQAHASLSAQLADRSLKRTYRAIVWGQPVPARGMIEGNIGRSPSNRKKMAVVSSGGKEAVTHYRVLEILGDLASLLECELETGRTHQIRVHLTHKGHSLVGDPVYGGSSASRLTRVARMQEHETAVNGVRSFTRQALHAAALRLVHPVSGEKMEFFAPVPPDMVELQAYLKHLKIKL